MEKPKLSPTEVLTDENRQAALRLLRSLATMVTAIELGYVTVKPENVDHVKAILMGTSYSMFGLHLKENDIGSKPYLARAGQPLVLQGDWLSEYNVTRLLEGLQ